MRPVPERLSRTACLAVLIGLLALTAVQGVAAQEPSTVPIRGDSAAVAYRIESVPFGAEVHLVRPSGTVQRLGTTPLDLRVAVPLDGDLVITLPGYVDAQRQAGRESGNVVRVVLEPRPGVATRDDLAHVVERETWRPTRWWADALAVGVAIAGTAVAVDQKTRADRLYATYRETGDPALRVPMKRHDTRAFVALGVGTTGLGVFALRLALRR